MSDQSTIVCHLKQIRRVKKQQKPVSQLYFIKKYSFKINEDRLKDRIVMKLPNAQNGLKELKKTVC